MRLLVSLSLLIAAAGVQAAPAGQLVFDQNDVGSAAGQLGHIGLETALSGAPLLDQKGGASDDDHQPPFDVLRVLSGISPYFSESPFESALPPTGCRVKAASWIIRHSSICANDDEWEETMEGFVQKHQHWIGNMSTLDRVKLALDREVGFLATWSSPVTEDNLEDITDSGKRDAKELGKTVAKLYPHLLPKPGNLSHYDVWAASSSRDVESAKAFIRGALPAHAGDGTGDSHVNLVKVDKHTRDWKESLTPHKACDRFDKSRGKPERRQFERVYTPAIIERLSVRLPGLNLTTEDIVGMQQLAGYENVIRGSSPLFAIFTEDEWRSFEYANDLWYHYAMGLAQPWMPVVGFPFLRTAADRILGTHDEDFTAMGKHAPNDTTSPQRLWFWFSHREEPPVIMTALGLFNNSVAQPGIPINDTMPLDRVNPDRLWRTSRILPFLGHVAIERLACVGIDNPKQKSSHVRVIVNGVPQPLPDCASGPGGACPIHEFETWFDNRERLFGNFSEVCAV